MQKKSLRSFSDYLPAIVTALLAVVTLILYEAIIEEHEVSDYFGICFIPIVPFVLIFINRKFKLDIPRYLIILICLHFVLAVYGGTAMGMYKLLSWWDLLVHGYFGFLGCAIFYYLYLRIEKQKPKPIHYIMFVLLTVSLAAIWEVGEFVADLFLHSDMQGVEAALQQGISPLTDTITDIMIAVVGAALFYAALFVIKVISKHKTTSDGKNRS